MESWREELYSAILADRTRNSLKHYGVKGMKWGVVKEDEPTSSRPHSRNVSYGNSGSLVSSGRDETVVVKKGEKVGTHSVGQDTSSGFGRDGKKTGASLSGENDRKLEALKQLISRFERDQSGVYVPDHFKRQFDIFINGAKENFQELERLRAKFNSTNDNKEKEHIKKNIEMVEEAQADYYDLFTNYIKNSKAGQENEKSNNIKEYAKTLLNKIKK